MPVVNPATGQLLGDLPIATAQDIADAAAAADVAFHEWRRRTALERARILHAIAASIRESSRMLAMVLTQEQGKVLPEALGEINSCADAFEWMAEEGKRVYGRIVPSRYVGVEQLVLHEPVGPVAAFSPWNYPAALACRKIATALAAGCSLVLKPAEEAPGTLVLIGRICRDAGLPEGALNVLFGVPDQISRQLIADERIRKVSFTGSVAVGRHLGTLAAAQMKKITLELGGHSPVIVCDDVDPEKLAALAVQTKFRNAGQICFSPTRFFVQDGVYDLFAKAFSDRAEALRLGNGLDDGVQMGPLIGEKRIKAMQSLVDDARENGAQVRTGGRVAKNQATKNFWEPTVLDVGEGQVRAMREEPFGPLALLRRFTSVDDVIHEANSTEFGLGSFVFTRSMDRAAQLQDALRAGNVSINTFLLTPPEMPFSGIKNSGTGSEMGSEGLISHFTTKSVFRSSNHS